jgi:heme-degrading monooxygenase HmoA
LREETELICRIWHGWTTASNADAYDSYLKTEPFPRLQDELGDCGYRGFHVLRCHHVSEVEFVTMVWFESLEAVEAFVGPDYETPVISEKARSVLLRYDQRVQHYELSGSSGVDFQRA